MVPSLHAGHVDTKPTEIGLKLWISEEVQLTVKVIILCLCVPARQPQIQLTREQQQILSHDIQKDHVVKIVAFAGTVTAIPAHGTVAIHMF